MSARVTIIANDIALDVYKDFDEKFWATRVIHDLRSLETRNASYTKSFTLPATSKNVSVLGPSLSVFNIPNQTGIKKVPTRVLMDGITVLHQGELIITSVTGKYIELEIELSWGNFDFFDAIKTINIQDLNYSDLNLTWDVAGITAIAQNTTGIVFCKDEWIDSEDIADLGTSINIYARTFQELRMNGFWIYLKEILNRLIVNAGYTIDDSRVTWDRWETVAMACPAHKWVEIEAKTGAYTGHIDKLTNTSVTDVGANTVIPFDGAVTDPNGQWVTGAANHWLIDTGTDPSRSIVFNATLNVVEVQQNPFFTPYVSIRKNGINVVQELYSVDFTGTTVLEIELLVVTGDTIDATIVAPDGSGVNGSTVQVLASGSFFEMNEVGGIDPDDSLIVANYIPQMSAEKFVISLCNMANIIIYAREADRVIELVSFDSISTADQQDLSSKIIVNKPIGSTNIISSYFQKNELKYSSNGNILRNDVDGVFFFNDDLLGQQGTIIQLDFDACDNAVWMGDGSCSASWFTKDRVQQTGITTIIATNTFSTTDPTEFNIGDYIEVGVDIMRITSRTSDTDGIIDGVWSFSRSDTSLPFFIHRHKHGDFDLVRVANIDQTVKAAYVTDGILDGSSTTSVNMFVAQFDSEMTFQFMADSHYSNLLNVLSKPLVITAWFNINTNEFLNLSQLRLAYINYFDSVFYINKIEQYKVGKPVRMELIRAISLTGVGRSPGNAYNYSGIEKTTVSGVPDFERTSTFYYKGTLKTGAGSSTIVMWDNIDADNNNRGLLISSAGTGSSIGNKISVAMLNTNLSTARIDVRTTDEVLSDTEQRTVEVWYDGSSNASGITIHVDGEDKDITVFINGLVSTILTGDDGFAFGKWKTLIAPSNAHVLSDVEFWIDSVLKFNTECNDNGDLVCVNLDGDSGNGTIDLSTTTRDSFFIRT